MSEGHQQGVEPPLSPSFRVLPPPNVEEVDLRFLAWRRIGQPHGGWRCLSPCLRPVPADVPIERPPPRLQLLLVAQTLIEDGDLHLVHAFRQVGMEVRDSLARAARLAD